MKKSELLLTKEEFGRVIKTIEYFRECELRFNDVIRHINEDGYAFIFSPYETQFVGLLERMFHDEFDEDIEYFLYDLECGKNWQPGDVMLDGVDIKMQTADDLYDHMVSCMENDVEDDGVKNVGGDGPTPSTANTAEVGSKEIK